MLDPFGALADFVLGKMKQSAMALWMKLLFTMAFSAIASFLFICGSLLSVKVTPAVAVGTGMVVAAMAMVVLFRRSPLTKGLMVVLPADEAAKELETGFQVIQKN